VRSNNPNLDTSLVVSSKYLSVLVDSSLIWFGEAKAHTLSFHKATQHVTIHPPTKSLSFITFIGMVLQQHDN
jgi:hypothetical protein